MFRLMVHILPTFTFFILIPSRPFFTNGRKSPSTSQVEMMANGGAFPYYHDSLLDCEIIGFPYKGNRTSLYVILPSNSDRSRLQNLEATLTPDDLERLVDSTKYTPSIVTFPKMRIERTLDLRRALMRMGVKSLFNPTRANLALLSPGITSKLTGTVSGMYDSKTATINKIRYCV